MQLRFCEIPVRYGKSTVAEFSNMKCGGLGLMVRVRGLVRVCVRVGVMVKVVEVFPVRESLGLRLGSC